MPSDLDPADYVGCISAEGLLDEIEQHMTDMLGLVNPVLDGTRDDEAANRELHEFLAGWVRRHANVRPCYPAEADPESVA